MIRSMSDMRLVSIVTETTSHVQAQPILLGRDRRSIRLHVCVVLKVPGCLTSGVGLVVGMAALASAAAASSQPEDRLLLTRPEGIVERSLLPETASDPAGPPMPRWRSRPSRPTARVSRTCICCRPS
jgi:hypothetical protein